MSEPRVLHVIGSLERGGTEQQLVEFIRRSPEPERHVVATFSSGGPLADRLPEPPVLLGPLGRGFRDVRDDLTVRSQLRRLVRHRGIDLVHAHLSMSELLAAAAVPHRVPIVASRRGRNLRYERVAWFRACEAIAHRRVRLMLCNSRELARFTLDHDLSPPPVMVVPNGVDLERFAPSLLPPEPVVAVVANLIAYKRHDLFLRAFESVARAVPEARAVLVGEGPERARLEKLAAELGLVERVDFRGAVADVRPHVAEARVVALASLHEGTPNALLEAMAMGRPVAATGVGGVPDLVRAGVDGLLPDATPAAFAAAIVSLLTDTDGATAMGVRARERAESYGWDRVVRRTSDAYRRVLSGERFPRRRMVA
jgi:glycosyltransferase involved in cell wall biosynthesis